MNPRPPAPKAGALPLRHSPVLFCASDLDFTSWRLPGRRAHPCCHYMPRWVSRRRSMPKSAVTVASVNDIPALQRDFERSQRAARRSPRTIQTYREGGQPTRRVPGAVGDADRGDVAPPGARRGLHGRAEPTDEACHRLQPLPSVAAVLQVPRGGRWRSSARPWSGCAERRCRWSRCPCCRRSSSRHCWPPARATTSSPGGTRPLCRLFVDTGMRRAELLGLRVADIDFDQDVALVMGKGRKPRTCPSENKTGLALGRYLRLRGGSRVCC